MRRSTCSAPLQGFLANSVAKLHRCEISSLRTGALPILRSQRGVGAGLDAAFGLVRSRLAGRLSQSIRDPETERFW